MKTVARPKIPNKPRKPKKTQASDTFRETYRLFYDIDEGVFIFEDNQSHATRYGVKNGYLTEIDCELIQKLGDQLMADKSVKSWSLVIADYYKMCFGIQIDYHKPVEEYEQEKIEVEAGMAKYEAKLAAWRVKKEEYDRWEREHKKEFEIQEKEREIAILQETINRMREEVQSLV